ncbi:MAG: ABC transporter permease [Cumulibacter sp.]
MTALETGGGELVSTTDSAANHSRRDVLRAFLGQPATVVSLGFILLLIVVSLAAPLLSTHDPHVQDLNQGFRPYSAENWLGTDKYGRDVLTRLMYAGRIALVAPTIAILVAIVLGLPAGLWAGMRGGRVDTILSTIADTLLSVPALVFALAVIAVMGRGLTNAMIAIGVMLSPHLFRIVRGATMVVAEETFITSARAIGSGTGRTMLRHVLPNIAAPLLVQVTLLMAISLLAEAGLSFLGLGVQPPDASWGVMLKAAYEDQFTQPWAVIPPGVAIVLTVLALNTIGDGLRDALAGRKSHD